MQVARLCSRVSRARSSNSTFRLLSSVSRSNPPPPTVVPWFLEPSEVSAEETTRNSSPSSHLSSPVSGSSTLNSHPPLPAELPSTSVLAQLYDLLKTSPHLESGTLLVREPIPTSVGPPLPLTAPKGRRQRGRTYFGEGLNVEGLESGGLWNWIMVAQVNYKLSLANIIYCDLLTLLYFQVKEGTEKRGAIESVVRLVRKAVCELASETPSTNY